MKSVSFYHKETGILHRSKLMTSDERIVALNTPADHVAIEGHHDHRTKRVEVGTQTVVDYTPPVVEPTEVERRHEALAKIRALEASQPRALREAALGYPDALPFLRQIDEEIKKLRPVVAAPAKGEKT